MKHPATFFICYVLALIPTYILPYFGSNSLIVSGLLTSTPFWLHLSALYVSIVIAWFRGRLIRRSWLPVFPAIAAAFDVAPGLNWIPLIPTALHVATLIMGVTQEAQADCIIGTKRLIGSACGFLLLLFIGLSGNEQSGASAAGGTAEAASMPMTSPSMARNNLTDAQAGQSAAETKAKAAQDLAVKQAAILGAANQLHANAASLIAGIDRAPNFGAQAAANSARIKKMLYVAPTLSEVDRGQLSVAANQAEVDTNQIEVARSQYALGLNQIIQDAAPVVAGVQKACSSPQAAQLSMQCNEAKSALAAFRAAFQHGQAVFVPYKKQVQAELDRQAVLLQRIDE